ncbi:MAG TPA: HNH endonuclease signature motif containing protein, partial [Candidatus Kapabacteria bacterium]
EGFKYLSLQKQPSIAVPEKAFDRETKSGVFLKKAMSQAMRCSICGGYIHRNSITTDHVIRKEDGGMGVI